MTLRLILGGSKGGISRTTTTANTAMSLALSGKRVMVLDLDPQANMTNLMGKTYYRNTGKQMTIPQTMMYGLAHQNLQDSVVKIIKNLYLVPSTFNFKDYPDYLLKLLVPKSSSPQDFKKMQVSYLSQAMKPVEAKYQPDIVMVDLPPSPDLFEASGIYYIGHQKEAGQIVFIMQVQSFSYDGARQFRQFTQGLINQYGLNLNVVGAVPVMYQKRSSSETAVLSKMYRDFHGNGLLFQPILYRERLKHYSISGMPTPNNDPHDREIKRMFDKLAKEILTNIKKGK